MERAFCWFLPVDMTCLSVYHLLLLTLSPLLSRCSPASCGPGRSWAVRLDAVRAGRALERLAQSVAEEVGLENHGQIGQLEAHYLLCQPLENTADVDSGSTESALDRNPHVLWYSQEHILRRSKRSVTFNDPKYPSQWHLVSIVLDCIHSDMQRGIAKVSNK